MRIRPSALAASLLLAALALPAQEAPLLTVVPRNEHVRRLELRADLKMIRKGYWEAIDLYSEALRLSPNNAVLLNKLGIANHQLSNLSAAKKFYERATKADPGYAQAWNNLGSIHYARKDYKRAIRLYERALTAEPTQAAIHGNLGAALFARKKFDQAFEQFRLALLLNPEVFQQRNLFGVLMQDYSTDDRARFHYLLAKSFASIASVERALFFLRSCLENGFPMEEALADPAFDLVREDRRFQALFTNPPAPLPR
ncbi:MAG: tetratricopeptide repeat protein [Candidatus Acidiferrales bacterium]